MKTVKLTCQNCGANLDVKGNIAFCSYCGAKLVMDDENRTTTHNYHYNYTHTKRDEARIRENERKDKRDNMIGLNHKISWMSVYCPNDRLRRILLSDGESGTA